MKITVETIEHIKRLAISRQAGSQSQADSVELFDSIDCLDLDELSELSAIVCIGEFRALENYGSAVADAKIRGTGVADYLFGLSELGTYLVSGTSLLKLV